MKLSSIILEETNQSFNEFAEGRAKGAGKIAESAKEKGGDSMLTHHHFSVKLPYYKKAADGNFDLEEAKKEFESTHKKISMGQSQVNFQKGSSMTRENTVTTKKFPNFCIQILEE